MAFTTLEMQYLRSQPLGRLATVSASGQPDNAAVGFSVADDGVITIQGMDMLGSRKGRNVQDGNTRVALIVDDLASVDPWRPRGVRIYGTAELRGADLANGKGGHLVIRPTVSWSWGIEPGAPGVTGFRPHRIRHRQRNESDLSGEEGGG